MDETEGSGGDVVGAEAYVDDVAGVADGDEVEHVVPTSDYIRMQISLWFESDLPASEFATIVDSGAGWVEVVFQGAEEDAKYGV